MILICPKCKKELIEYKTSLKCLNNHNFDKSKRGYVNLLLANQMNSSNPGDNKEMVKARKEFLNKDYYDLLRKKVCSLIAKGNVLDLGCGEGYYSLEIAKKENCEVYGLDISKEMINEASKETKTKNNLSYVIASINNLVFKDNSFDYVVNIFAPINVNEVKRVLKKDGKLIKVIPGEYHLYELKELLYDQIYLNEINRLNDLKLINEYRLKYSVKMDNKDLNNLFMMTPYYYKTKSSDKEKIKNVLELEITFDFYIQEYKYS